MLQTAIRIGLIYGVFFLLISATAMMGLKVNVKAELQASIFSSGVGISGKSITDVALPEKNNRLPSTMAGAVNVCCPCESGQTCSVEKPQTNFARLFADLGDVRFISLATQPPDTPPRT